MRIDGTTIRMTRGDSETINLNIKGYEPTGNDFVEMTVRRNVNSDVVFYRKLNVNENGSAIIEIKPNDTEELQFGAYVYDVQLTYGSIVKTIVKTSLFIIEKEVTYGDT